MQSNVHLDGEIGHQRLITTPAIIRFSDPITRVLYHIPGLSLPVYLFVMLSQYLERRSLALSKREYMYRQHQYYDPQTYVEIDVPYPRGN
jgi:hypothetical protein